MADTMAKGNRAVEVPASAADAPSMRVQESNKMSGTETRARVPSLHHSLPKYECYTVPTLLSDDLNLGRRRTLV